MFLCSVAPSPITAGLDVSKQSETEKVVQSLENAIVFATHPTPTYLQREKLSAAWLRLTHVATKTRLALCGFVGSNGHKNTKHGGACRIYQRSKATHLTDPDSCGDLKTETLGLSLQIKSTYGLYIGKGKQISKESTFCGLGSGVPAFAVFRTSHPFAALRSAILNLAATRSKGGMAVITEPLSPKTSSSHDS